MELKHLGLIPSKLSWPIDIAKAVLQLPSEKQWMNIAFFHSWFPNSWLTLIIIKTELKNIS